MKKTLTLFAAVLSALPNFVLGVSSNQVSLSGESRVIIPPVSDFTFNERWINPTLCGDIADWAEARLVK